MFSTSWRSYNKVVCSCQSSVVKYNDKRPVSEQKAIQLFFVAFEWRDPFVQEVRDVSEHIHIVLLE